MKRLQLNAPWLSMLLVASIAAVYVSGAGCSGKNDNLNAIRTAYEAHDYEETLVQCRHALRTGADDVEVQRYYGLALLAMGRDFEAFEHFRKVVATDPKYSAPLARHLVEWAGDAYGRGDTRRASDCLLAAIDIDPAISGLGFYRYLVADAYFEQKQFSEAERYYKDALAEYPDTAIAEGALYNLSQCHIANEDSSAAIADLETQLERFPKGDLSEQALWRLSNLLYESARSDFARGNYEAVVETVGKLLERTDNQSLVQRARFVLGEAYERLGDYAHAYEQYRAIIDEDRGASGRVVERARERIAAFRDSGLL